MNVIKKSNHKKPFNITRMNDNFLEFKKIFVDCFPSKNTIGEKFVWNQLKWIKVTKNSQTVTYGTSHRNPEERSLSFDIDKYTNTTPMAAPNYVPISNEKYADLISMHLMCQQKMRNFIEI